MHAGTQEFYLLFSIRSGEEGASVGGQLEQGGDPYQRVVLAVRARKGESATGGGGSKGRIIFRVG